MRIAALALLLLVPQDKTQELTTVLVEKAPTIDGDASDEAWSKAAETKISLWRSYDDTDRRELRVRVCRTADEIFFLLTWKDASKDTRHHPWIWKQDAGKYDELDVAEDAAALSFALEGEFNPDMTAGIESKWDVWRWGAARTNAVGHAADKLHQYSRSKLGGRASQMTAPDGKPVWILMIDDVGKAPTRRVDQPEKQGADEVPQFEPQKPEESAADVRAKGAWNEKTWTLEFARKLSTGRKDDTAFEVGKSCAMSVAIFDHEESGDHFVGPKLMLAIK